MKIYKKSLFAILVFVTILSVLSLMKVSAQDTPLNNQQIDQIYGNCTAAKNTLNQLHSSDALLRVNIGQIYESISTKLMDKFNGRLAKNSFDNVGFNSIFVSYNSALDIFRSDYKTYEEQLNSAINIDCEKQPILFYDAVVLARTDRIKVHDDIVMLNKFVDQYQTAVLQFEKDYQNSVEGLKP